MIRLRSRRAQAMVEFALVSTLLLIFVLGIIDFAWLFTTRSQAFQGVRIAARYAATNPDAWSRSSNPSSGSIESKLQLSTVKITNDDAHIVISYWVAKSSTSEIECGFYKASNDSFQSMNGYHEDTCLVPGTMIQIQATYTYTYITPLLKGTLHSTTIVVTASAMEELSCSSNGGEGGDGDGGGCSGGGDGDGNGGGHGGD